MIRENKTVINAKMSAATSTTTVEPETPQETPFEWKLWADSFQETTSNNNKYVELIGSILRWKDLFDRKEPSEEPFISSFALVSTYYVIHGVNRVERANILDVIEVTKLLLKYVVENILPNTTVQNQILTVNSIKSLCFSQNCVSLDDLKDYLESLKSANPPVIDKTDPRLNSSDKLKVDILEDDSNKAFSSLMLLEFYSLEDGSNGAQNSASSKSTFQRILSEKVHKYLQELDGEKALKEALSRLSLSSLCSVSANDVVDDKIEYPSAVSEVKKTDIELIRVCVELSTSEELANYLIDLTLKSLVLIVDLCRDEKNECLISEICQTAMKILSKNLGEKCELVLTILTVRCLEKCLKNGWSDLLVPLISVLIVSSENLFSNGRSDSSLEIVKKIGWSKVLLDLIFGFSSSAEEIEEKTSEESFDLENLFLEKNVVRRKSFSCSSSRRKSIENDLLEFGTKFVASKSFPFFRSEFGANLNSKKKLSEIVLASSRNRCSTRFLSTLIERNLFEPSSEIFLIEKLSEESFSNFLVFRLVSKEKNRFLISKLVENFLGAKKFSLESTKIHLIFFHQIEKTRRNKLLLDFLVRLENEEKNLEIFSIFEYFLSSFDKIHPELIEFGKNFSLTGSTTALDVSSRLFSILPVDNRLFDEIPFFDDFRARLVERLDFSRRPSTKPFVEKLWKILASLRRAPGRIEVRSCADFLDFLRFSATEKENFTLRLSSTSSPFEILVFRKFVERNNFDEKFCSEIFLETLQIFLGDSKNEFSSFFPLVARKSSTDDAPRKFSTLDDFFLGETATFFDRPADETRNLWLKEILKVFGTVRPKIRDVETFLRIEIDENLDFLRGRVQLEHEENFSVENEVLKRRVDKIFDVFRGESPIDENFLRDALKFFNENFRREFFSAEQIFHVFRRTSNEQIRREICKFLLKILPENFRFDAKNLLDESTKFDESLAKILRKIDRIDPRALESFVETFPSDRLEPNIFLGDFHGEIVFPRLVRSIEQFRNSTELFSFLNDFLIAAKFDGSNLSTLDESNSDDETSPENVREQNFPNNDFDPNQLCTFTKTKKDYANQHWYHCHTCQMIERVGICQICANVCHRDHEISYAKYGSFFCDCGAKEDASCQALTKRSTSKIETPPNNNNTSSNNNKTNHLLTSRQRRLHRQIEQNRDKFQSIFNDPTIQQNIEQVFLQFGKYLNENYQQIFDRTNRFDLTESFLQSKNRINLDNDESKTNHFLLGLIYSHENAFENVKTNFSNDHGQQIKQLLNTNSIRRQGISIVYDQFNVKQQIIVAQEKGKQSMITIYPLHFFLKSIRQITAADISAKKKISINKSNTINLPFSILSIQPNPFHSEYLCLTGLKDCQVFHLDSTGKPKEPTIIVQPNLDSTGNYIIRSLWLNDRSRTQLALITADFIKIFDLAVDSTNPTYYFILPAGKIRDATFFYTKRNNRDTIFILIMSSNGYIYYEQLSDTTSAQNGSFYVTNTLEIKHDTITETNNNGILLGGGVSVYYSCTLKLLFWSYVQGKNFYGIIDENNLEKLLYIQPIDVKMTPTSTNNATKTTTTFHTLSAWSEVVDHPGLICAMTLMTNSPIVLMITPTSIHHHEIRMQTKTSKIQDFAAIRCDQRTNLFLVADDGTLKVLFVDDERSNYWINRLYEKKKYFPLADVEQIDHQIDYETSAHYQYALSDNETDDQQENDGKRRKLINYSTSSNITHGTMEQTSSTSTIATTATGMANVKFPPDFFEQCSLLNDYEFGGRDLLDVYNVAQLKLRLSTPGMFIANARANGFTLDVINKDWENMVLTGVRIHVGAHAPDKSPQHFEVFGRTIQVQQQQNPRWYDICLTREESIQAEKKLSIVVAPSNDPNHFTFIDTVKVYGKRKVDFQWPTENELLTITSTKANHVAQSNDTQIKGQSSSNRIYAHHHEQEISSLSKEEQIIIYTMQILTNLLSLRSQNVDDQEKSVKVNEEILQSTLNMIQLSLPTQLQRHCRLLLKQILIINSNSSSNDTLYHEHVDRIQLSILSKCLSSDDYLEYFHTIEVYEYLLMSLWSIARHRPQNIQRFLNIQIDDNKDAISKSASIERFITALVDVFFNILNRRSNNRLIESIDCPMIDNKRIERLLHILVDIYHSLALNESEACQKLIIDSYIRLLTYHDYHINFMIKNALNRCMQPKIQRLISKLSTASDLNQQDTNNVKSFPNPPLSAGPYLSDELVRPTWANRNVLSLVENPASDEASMLQLALALSLQDNTTEQQISAPTELVGEQQVIEFVDVEDETSANINVTTTSVTPETPANTIGSQSQNDNSDNNSLYEGDDGHASESSSTANEAELTKKKNTSTPISNLAKTPTGTNIPDSSSSNDSTTTLKLNLNDSIDPSHYEQRLYDFKHLIVEQLLDRIDEHLLRNHQLNGLNAIAYLQLLLSLTIEFASKSDDRNRQFVLYILKSLLRQMTFLKESTKTKLIERTAEHEIQLMLLRLFTVYVSFMLKVRSEDREQYLHLSLSACKLLEETNAVDYCLHALKNVYEHLSTLPIDENLLGEQTNPTSNNSAVPLMKLVNQSSLPDLSPFFYKQYTKHHCNDVFEVYPELLAEIATRLPYQMKKIFDSTAESRSFLSNNEWQKCLCEYYFLAQAAFLKRQIRKLLMYICGSRDKYRKIRDIHVLESNLEKLKELSRENIFQHSIDQRKSTNNKQVPYSVLMRLVDHLKSCHEISTQRSSNWQKFCKNDSTVLKFLVDLILVIDESVVPFILQLLISAISSMNNSRPLKQNKPNRSSDFEGIDDVTICSIANQFSKTISKNDFEMFVRLFLLENNQTSIRWLTHSFLYNLYTNGHKHLQDNLFDLFLTIWTNVNAYGQKAFQYVDLLGYMIIKNKDDQRTIEFLPKLETMLKKVNTLLVEHPNGSVYRRLSSIIDIESNNGYYFENEPCLVCNNPDIPYQQVKLQSIKLDQRYTTQSHVIKLLQPYSIQKLAIKMSEVKRNKAVRTIRFFYNNRQVQSIVDLKNSVNCKWLLAKTIRLSNIQQTEVKIDFVIPIVACNLMIEYVDFFETNNGASSSVNDTATLQCPRCNSAVAATPGICPNCGENVFQCHKCRAINYDERDPFLCNSCGYCKYCKFDFIFTAKQINFVEPIESDEDRTKILTNIGQLLEKTDRIYRQLLNQKPIIEYLLTKFQSDDQSNSNVISLSNNNPTNTGENAEAATFPTTSNANGINRVVQQIAPKYNIECRQTYDELGKYIQKIICARKELLSYDQRQTASNVQIRSSENCYGCTLATISHCVLLLRAFVASSNRLKQMIISNYSLIDELLYNNIRYTSQQIRNDVRLLFCYLTRDQSNLTEYVMKKILSNIELYFNERKFLSSSSSLINYDLFLLYSMIQRTNQDDQDVCWESKVRCLVQLFLHSLELLTPSILEFVTLPCLRMLLHLSKAAVNNSATTKSHSIDVDRFLRKEISYHDWMNSSSSTSNVEKPRAPKNSWLEKLIFSPQSATIRYLTCKLIQTLCVDEKQKVQVLQILIDFLHCVCDRQTSKYSSEYVQLLKDLLTSEQILRLLLIGNDDKFHFIQHLAKLIEQEIILINEQDERLVSNGNFTFGYPIKCLTELLTICLQQDEFKQKYKSQLIAIVLNGYLSLKKLIIQRTKLIDEAQTKMLELLEQMTRGNEQETRQFMKICIDTIEKFPNNDMQTPQFLFERLCNLIYPEEAIQSNKEFFLIVEKDPNQEDFLQGRMMGNPYSSNDPSMGPLMRDIKNKICTDCELIVLLEDDNGMELLVGNKIINLGLSVRDVYKKVWIPFISGNQAGNENNEHEPMHIVYRMRGLLGDATEDIIENFETKKNTGENGEDDPEETYRLATVLAEHNGLETMLKRLDSIENLTDGKALLQIIFKLFEYAVKLEVNRQRLIEPNLRSISSMLNKLNLLLKTEIEEQGRDQSLLSLTERLLTLMDQLFHEASTTLSQDKYNEFSVSCEGDIEQLRSLLNYIRLPFVKSHPTLMQALIHLLPYLSFGNKEKMQTLLDYFKSYLEFDRFDHEQLSTTTSTDNDSQLHLDCFCEISKHLDRKSIYGKEFRDLVNETNGIIEQCIKYIERNSPPVKTYLGMQDQDIWKEFLTKPSLSYVLRLLTGLSSGHEPIQMKIAASLIPILHKIEQLTTAGKVGVLAEDLLHSLTENSEVAKQIDFVRNQTRAEKKRLAQEARARKMLELKLKTKEPRNKSQSESSALATRFPLSQIDLPEETGHVCCICREGYKYVPNKVLAIYTFTKKVDLEPFENKPRKTPGYSTVTHFNIIHVDCHQSAVKQARAREEWESALLQNANTRCNGLLPLWGPDVPEAQFTTALARYDTNIIEGTGIRETSATLSIHDVKLLLLRFAESQSFSEDTGGGGRESNIRLIPYQIHAILYVLNTTRQIEREEKILQNFLGRTEPPITEAFEIDGPYFVTTLALIIMKPADWEKHRLTFLQRLLLTAHIRSTNNPNDRTKVSSKVLKSFTTYKTAMVFFGLVNSFFVQLLRPRLDSESKAPYHQQLAQFIRSNDAFIMEACTKILKQFEQDLINNQQFDGLFKAIDFEQLSESWLQQIINALP